MKTLKTNAIPLITVPIVIAFIIIAALHIIDMTNAGLINWNN